MSPEAIAALLGLGLTVAGALVTIAWKLSAMSTAVTALIGEHKQTRKELRNVSIRQHNTDLRMVRVESRCGVNHGDITGQHMLPDEET